MIRAIAAVDAKRGIANDHGIPWAGRVPSDVAYFRKMTEGGVIVMGAGVYKELDAPLPNRRNIVASSSEEPLREGFEKITDARAFIESAQEDVWVIGGAALFASTIDLIEELHLTFLDQDFGCTKFFPAYDEIFQKVNEQPPIIENGITLRITIWKRLSKRD
jgi:dihydrofolate reductase